MEILSHAKLGHKNIEETQYDTPLGMITDIRYFFAQEDKNRRVVYLLSYENCYDGFPFVAIHHDPQIMIDILDSSVFTKSMPHLIFLQEYESYQAAYSVALSMMEPCDLCYDNPELN